MCVYYCVIHQYVYVCIIQQENGSDGAGKLYLCAQCPFKCLNKEELTEHESANHNAEINTCQSCQISFSHVHMLVKHMKEIHNRLISPTQLQKVFLFSWILATLLLSRQPNTYIIVILTAGRGIVKFELDNPDGDGYSILNNIMTYKDQNQNLVVTVRGNRKGSHPQWKILCQVVKVLSLSTLQNSLLYFAFHTNLVRLRTCKASMLCSGSAFYSYVNFSPDATVNINRVIVPDVFSSLNYSIGRFWAFKSNQLRRMSF